MLEYSGVARFDIEVAQVRGFDLDSVVRKAVQKLRRHDDEILAEFKASTGNTPVKLTVQDYRVQLVRNLRYIEQLQLSHVPWGAVEELVPESRTMPFDVATHARELSFRQVQARQDEDWGYLGP
jgi:hypothetical protein